MRNDYSERSERLVGYWWLSLIAGVVLIAIGFIVMVNPAESYFSFATWFGFAVMVTGVLTLVQGLSSNNRYVRRGWLILASIADIIIGIILVFNSLVSAFVMPILLGVEAVILFVAIAFVSYGVSMITLGFRLLDVHRSAKRLGADE